MSVAAQKDRVHPLLAVACDIDSGAQGYGRDGGRRARCRPADRVCHAANVSEGIGADASASAAVCLKGVVASTFGPELWSVRV